MTTKKKTVEILAPAGSYESMAAAVAAGADAVYIGGSRFGARAFADNPGEDRLLEAIDYAHLHGVKLYMTVNTLFKEDELIELYDYLKPYYERGLDAVIVQDMGAFAYIRSHFPLLPIHASTQMTITGVHGARILAGLGAERIVMARELSLEEIREIHDELDVEIESFVHGALCYCYSGQCLLSSLIGGRSGNRGRCAQPCRLPYEVKRDGKTLNSKDERYLLSPKDLCTLDIIPRMIEAGVYSMKIEGRMKSPRYTAGVVSIYRKYVNRYLKDGADRYTVEDKDRKLLLDLFDRGGHTQGYYQKHNGRDMITLKEKPAFREGNQKLFDYLDTTYVNAVKQEPVSAFVRVAEGEPVKLTLQCRGHLAAVCGQVPLEAVNQPMTAEKIEKQIRKTGNTPFYMDRLDVEVEGNVFLPVQALNELRRQGLEELEKAMLSRYWRISAWGEAKTQSDRVDQTRPEVTEDCQTPKQKNLTVYLESPGLLDTALKESAVSGIYLGADGFVPAMWQETVERCHLLGKQCFLAMPQIFRMEAREYYKNNKRLLQQAGFDALLLGAAEELEFLKDEGITEIPVTLDHNLYLYNHLAVEQYRQIADSCGLKLRRQTLPLELNGRELEGLCGQWEFSREMIVYGRIPVMITAQCIRKTVEGCSRKPEILTLKDRMGKEFPVRNHCTFCYNTIYNTSPLSLLGQKKLLDRIGAGSFRLNFTTEDRETAEKVLKAFANELVRGGQEEEPVPDFTRGHFKRGVE